MIASLRQGQANALEQAKEDGVYSAVAFFVSLLSKFVTVKSRAAAGIRPIRDALISCLRLARSILCEAPKALESLFVA